MENLRKLRKERGIKQEEIANFLNISRGSYSRYETGARNPDPETLKKLSDFFDVSIDYLVSKIDVPATPAEMEFYRKMETQSTEELLKQYSLTNKGNELSADQQRELLETLRTATSEDLKKMLAFLRALRED